MTTAIGNVPEGKVLAVGVWDLARIIWRIRARCWELAEWPSAVQHQFGESDGSIQGNAIDSVFEQRMVRGLDFDQRPIAGTLPDRHRREIECVGVDRQPIREIAKASVAMMSIGFATIEIEVLVTLADPNAPSEVRIPTDYGNPQCAAKETVTAEDAQIRSENVVGGARPIRLVPKQRCSKREIRHVGMPRAATGATKTEFVHGELSSWISRGLNRKAIASLRIDAGVSHD